MSCVCTKYMISWTDDRPQREPVRENFDADVKHARRVKNMDYEVYESSFISIFTTYNSSIIAGFFGFRAPISYPRR